MSIISRLFGGGKRPPTATVAKERLQIVLAHERASRDAPDFLPVLQQELLMVVAKYFHVQDDMIKIQVERSGETSVLEINVELDKARIKARGEAAAREAKAAADAKLPPPALPSKN